MNQHSGLLYCLFKKIEFVGKHNTTSWSTIANTAFSETQRTLVVNTRNIKRFIYTLDRVIEASPSRLNCFDARRLLCVFAGHILCS